MVDFGLDYSLCAGFGICMLVYKLNYGDFNVPIDSDTYCLRAIYVEDDEFGSGSLRMRGKGRWEQYESGGGLLESSVVNLQTASQSGNGERQDSKNSTAQLHLVIALRLISLSPFQPLIPAVPFACHISKEISNKNILNLFALTFDVKYKNVQGHL